MGKNHLFVVMFEKYNYSFLEMYFKIIFVHVYTCSSMNSGALGLVYWCRDFIEESSNSRSSKAGCIAQSTASVCSCPLLPKTTASPHTHPTKWILKVLSSLSHPLRYVIITLLCLCKQSRSPINKFCLVSKTPINCFHIYKGLSVRHTSYAERNRIF